MTGTRFLQKEPGFPQPLLCALWHLKVIAMSLGHQLGRLVASSAPLGRKLLAPPFSVKVTKSGQQRNLESPVIRSRDTQQVMPVSQQSEVVFHRQMRTQMMLDDNLQRHRQENALPTEIDISEPLSDIGMMAEKVAVKAIAKPRIGAGKNQLEAVSNVHGEAPSTGVGNVSNKQSGEVIR
jgi:hypothetical protein